MNPVIRIVEPDDFSSEALAWLQERADVRLAKCTAEELPALFAEVDVLWLRLGHRVTKDTLPAAPRCRILASPVTGLDHIDVEACQRHGVQVISLKGETEFLRTVRATAEHTLGLALSVLRHIPRAHRSVSEGKWTRDSFRGNELYGKRAGIVGMGRLGGIMADYYRALGMSVAGYDVPERTWPDDIPRCNSLTELFAQSDLVSIHVSYSADTHHLIDQAILNCCKPGSCLINTARGAVIDENALVSVLQSKKLAAAAVDVLEGEPDIGQSRLVAYARSHHNVIITPHIGGNTYESFARTELFLAQRVLEFWHNASQHPQAGPCE